MKLRLVGLLVICMLSLEALAQTKVGDKWVDKDLTLMLVNQNIRSKGEFYVCVWDSARSVCIENLVTGFEIEIMDQNGKVLYQGTASGRRKGLRLPEPLPTAGSIKLKAFKPWVINKSTGTYIYQEDRITVKYPIK